MGSEMCIRDRFYPLSDEEIAIEQEKVDRFVASLPKKRMSQEEFDAIMDSLPEADPDPDYPPELHEKYMAIIAEAKARKQLQTA